MNTSELIKTLCITAPLLFLLSCSEGCRCSSPMRNYQVNTDKKIVDLTDKIKELESGGGKDIKTSDSLASAYNQLGLIYLEKKLWEQAIDSFQKCIKLGANSASINYSIGLAYANRGHDAGSNEDFEMAEKHYRRSIELQNNFNDAKYALSMLYFFKLEKKDEAILLITEIVSANKKYYKARFALGRFLYEIEKPDKALNVYEDLYTDLEKLPDNQATIEYRDSCKANINRIMSELSQGKGKR
jgi:tetratricopeptide (TPR) repeat protein